MKPIVKWAGGKRIIAPEIVRLLNVSFNHYFEPFLGGGGVLFYLHPNNATCYDLNPELINLYNVVKEDVSDLIEILNDEFIPNHSKEFYYYVRGLDRDSEAFLLLSKTYRAARILYLNKTCFNGLWRVNSDGHFNVPFGKYKKPSFTEKEVLLEAHQYFATKNITFRTCDFKNVISEVVNGDLVYFDPPYDLEKGENGFVSYTHDGFGRYQQEELKMVCDILVQKGATVGVSNSNTSFIKELYSEGPVSYELNHEIKVNRTVGSATSSRKQLNELLIIGRPK